MDALQKWLKGSTALVYTGDPEILMDFCKKNSKLQMYYRPYTYKTQHKIKENAIQGYRTIYVQKSIEEFCTVYLRSLAKERTQVLAKPEALSPAEIMEFISGFTYIHEDKDRTPYLFECMQVHSSPGLFIDDLITRCKSGQYQYSSMLDVPMGASLFMALGKIYMHPESIIKDWKTIFGYKCVFADVEIKRYIWGISKTVNLYTPNLRNFRYRQIQERDQ